MGLFNRVKTRVKATTPGHDRAALNCAKEVSQIQRESKAMKEAARKDRESALRQRRIAAEASEARLRASKEEALLRERRARATPARKKGAPKRHTPMIKIRHKSHGWL